MFGVSEGFFFPLIFLFLFFCFFLVCAHRSEELSLSDWAEGKVEMVKFDQGIG